ncbi:MAG: hypothetical protein ACYC6C_11195, partial [Coriobacteriia bacterium]
EHLQSVKLIFLTGLQISTRTLNEVKELVQKKGITVVTPPTLAPKFIKHKYKGGTQIIQSGNSGGRWIITNNVLDPNVKMAIKPLLGKKDEMRYMFGNDEVIFKIDKNDNLTKVN